MIRRVNGQDMAEKMERAFEASGKVIDSRALPAPETKPAQVVSPTPVEPLVTAERYGKANGKVGHE